MKKIDFPVMNVRMVPTEKIVANDYNPNHMASPEMRLLKISIEEDGYTQPIDQRIASTIRHNRARGTHQIVDMSHIVCRLLERGWDDARICKYLGMELDEVIRLKQMSGLKQAFAGHVFSKSWEKFERRLFEENPGLQKRAPRKE